MTFRHLLCVLVVAGLLAGAGCVGCESEPESTHTSERCPDRECVSCQDHDDCEQGAFCGRLEAGEFCVVQECEPNEAICEGDTVVRCDDVGSAFLEAAECDSGGCKDGACVCTTDDDCGVGEECIDGSCSCPSGVVCGDQPVCCPQDDSCEQLETCESGDEDCEPAEICLSACDGQICGAGAEYCCQGETPVCAPDGQCAPDCGENRQLCGEDFDTCCQQGDVCIFGECVTPGEPCEDFTDCEHGEYCDGGLGRCMPDDFPADIDCEVDYDFDPFDIDEMWHWDGEQIGGQFRPHVANTPAVADLDGDATPEVAFTAYPDGAIESGALVVVDGTDGSSVYTNAHHNLRAREAHAVGDVDGDGYPEIVVSTRDGIGVVDDIVSCDDPQQHEDGCYLWERAVDGSALNQAPVLADVTGDGDPEVVYLHSVFDATTGEVLATAPEGTAAMTVALDITEDGDTEILTGGCAWRYVDGEEELHEVWCRDELPGSDTLSRHQRNYVGVGDVVGDDRDGLPEVIWVGLGEVFVLEATSGETIERFDLPGADMGGPPVVADFDGDGRSEFAVGGQTCYTVFDFDCLGEDSADLPGCERPEFAECTPGEDCVVEPCEQLEGGTGDGILWSIEIVESVTGTGFASAVFDFQGNDRHEVVYGDHCRVFVLDGQTGEPLMTRLASRRANVEMPIVVDVDGDGRSNLLYQANSDQFGRDCADPIEDRPDYFPECHEDDPPAFCSEGNEGLIAIRDAHDSWVDTRPVWNQHAYHIDNVDTDGTIPASPAPPWQTHGTFRANQQGDIPLNAPDVVVSAVQVDELGCPPDLEFRVTIANEGQQVIDAGLPVSLYNDDTGELLETTTLDTSISPGGMAQVELSWEVPETDFNTPVNYRVVANDEDADVGELVEDCEPDKATSDVVEAICQITG